MKNGAMLLLMLTGLTGMGALQTKGDLATERAEAAELPGHSESAVIDWGPQISSVFYEDGHGTPGSVFSRISSRQPALEDIRKTLKGYRSINRKTYPIQLMELV